DVPKMKELMRHERAKSLITIAVPKSEATKTERRGIQMLEAATAAGAQMQKEGVVVIRNLAEHRHFCFHYFLDFGFHQRGVIVALAIDDDTMRHTTNAEIDLLEITDFKRRVVKNIEVFRLKSVLLARHRRQSGGDFPTGGRVHMNFYWMRQALVRIHQQRRVVPECVIGIQL